MQECALGRRNSAWRRIGPPPGGTIRLERAHPGLAPGQHLPAIRPVKDRMWSASAHVRSVQSRPTLTWLARFARSSFPEPCSLTQSEQASTVHLAMFVSAALAKPLKGQYIDPRYLIRWHELFQPCLPRGGSVPIEDPEVQVATWGRDSRHRSVPGKQRETQT